MRLKALGPIFAFFIIPFFGFPAGALAGDLLDIAQVAAGTAHTCALTATGGVKCWGQGLLGQLGNGSMGNSQAPVDVVGLSSGVVALAAGGHTNCAITATGGVKCWGQNLRGALGDGTEVDRSTPVDVVGIASGATAIGVGANHACAVVAGGALKCWGDDSNGQVGDGTTGFRVTPMDVQFLPPVVAVAPGGTFTCALSAGSGGVKCWGLGTSGELGNGSTASSLSPVDVTGLTSGVAALAAGYQYACALSSGGGGVRCWGFNMAGNLGDGTNILRTSPVNVSGLSGGLTPVAMITASRAQAHTCALTSVGGVKCWGLNTWGQAGATAAQNQLVPLDVVGMTSNVVGVSAGWGHTCAVTTAGKVLCWGNNDYGQLGNDAAGFGVPVTVGAPAASQTVTFDPIPNHDVNDAPVTLVASASSGLPVTFSSSSPSVCTVSAGTAVLVEIGICTIVARQAGDSTFSAAEASRSFLVTGSSAASFPRLGNISTRMQVLPGNDALIAGFAINGTQKTVLIRARGPSLASLGVAGPIQNPMLQLYRGQTLIDFNDDWASFRNAATIWQIGLAPTDLRESAIMVTLPNGLYTAVVTASGGSPGGVGIVEVFEIDAPDSPLVNISTRGQVLTGENVMIGGFIINGNAPQTVVVRARGPSLASEGVSGVLANPMLQLFSGQTQIAVNDDWQAATNAGDIAASGFAPLDPGESAILVTLPPGAYTAIVSGVGGTAGVGLVEVFAVP